MKKQTIFYTKKELRQLYKDDVKQLELLGVAAESNDDDEELVEVSLDGTPVEEDNYYGCSSEEERILKEFGF